jgi:gamma-glutamyltranspeptidase/glutathione hydrolase
VWDGKQLHGLNASGRAPAGLTPDLFEGQEKMPFRGWGCVTVPGAVSGWRALSERYGRLPFDTLFEPAIRYATDGFIVSPTVHRQWQEQIAFLGEQPGFAQAFAPNGRAPLPGERFRCEGQAQTLTRIAQTKGDAFYHGELAQAIVNHARNTGGVITLDDLAAHRADWVQPISTRYRDLELFEIGPNGQGIGALMALGILQNFDVSGMSLDSPEYIHLQIEAMKLAFADLHAYVADPDFMAPGMTQQLLDPAYLARRARLIDPAQASYPGPGNPHSGGTVYMTAADSSGMMVSLIQSNFKGFGSGVVVPGTGIALHNRGSGFSTQKGHPNQVGPGKRPFHTIIPGFLMKQGQPLASFGVMGGSIQAQGHVQVACRVADFNQSAQVVSDAPRWRVLDDNRQVRVEWNMPQATVQGLQQRGHAIQAAPRMDLEFGSAQIAMRLPGGGYQAASDHRKDGYPVGL